jgi:hypothetical protein
VSDYYDLYLALELREDLPEETLRELRYHCGLETEPPKTFQAFDDDGWYWDEPYPYLAAGKPSHAFAGADVTALVAADDRISLTVRRCVHDDELGWAMMMANWLASLSTNWAHTEGGYWIGYLRYTENYLPNPLFYADGQVQGWNA